MRLRVVLTSATLLGLALGPVLSCGGSDEPLAAGIAQIASVNERAAQHQALLNEKLLARDDLGPGEYRERLYAVHADLERALGLEKESRAAALLAQLAEVIAGAGERGRQLVGAHVPPTLAPWLSLSPVNLARAALEHASHAASGAVALRARAAESAPALADLRDRILSTRRSLARARLLVAEAMAALGPTGSAHGAELVPVARRHQVRVTQVRSLHNIGDLRMTRATIAMDLEAHSPREIAAFARELADRAGVRLDAIELARVSRGASANLRVTLRRARAGTSPLRLGEPSSTLGELERALADVSAWREALADALVPEPGPAIALNAIRAALPAGCEIERFAAADGRFAAVIRARGAAVSVFQKEVQLERRLELVTTSSSRGRVALRGQYRNTASPLAASALDTPVPEPPAPAIKPMARSKKALYVGNDVLPVAPAGASGWRLVGVASASKGEVRALLRDHSGKPHIVAVGGRLDDGAKVIAIHRDRVTVRLGTDVRQIRAAE